MLLGVALVLASCSGGKETEPAAVPSAPETPPTAPQTNTTKPGTKSGTKSAYSYSGPRVPGAKVSRVSVPGGYVALTFDDGPSPSLTPRVLDILKRHNAKATFFVVGRNVSHGKHILARAVAEGHEIGAHTWSHIKMNSSSMERVISEMDRTNAAIQQATGVAPKVMRPPYGATNANLVSLMKSRYGMSTIMWDVDTRDWQHPGVSVVTQRAVGNARPGSIILLHDIHSSTLNAVEGIVTGLQARGFRLVTVSQLLALNGHAARQAATITDTQAAQAAPAAESSPAPTPEQSAQPAAEPAPATEQPAATTPATEQSASPAPLAEPQPETENAGAASISGVTSL